MNKKILIISSIALLAAVFALWGRGALALFNPAARYCTQLGYEYSIKSSASGQIGNCKLPDGTECEEWAFFSGKCGQKYSYCVKKGYKIKTATGAICNHSYSSECSVCVSDGGGQKELLEVMRENHESLNASEPIPVSNTSSQEVSSLHCGNNICDPDENLSICPQDCKASAAPVQPEVPAPKKTNYTLTFLIVLFIALLGTAIIYLYRRFLA